MSPHNKKTILITGSSSGLGRATAQLFSSKGWNIIATMRNPDKEIELNKLAYAMRLQIGDEVFRKAMNQQFFGN